MHSVVDRGDQITFVGMQLRLQFFGNLTDVVSSSTLEWKDDAEVQSVGDLLDKLYSGYPNLNGKTFRVAVNHQFVELDFALSSGDEVALMPPFSGG